MATILVLDDDKRFSASLAALLEGLGYDVLQARSVTQAEELVVETVPDLALVDIVLPGPEPDGLIQSIIKLRGSLPVVLMSGFFQGGDSVDRMMRLCGTDIFLAKPFDFDRLVALLRRLLGDPMALSDGAQEPLIEGTGRLDETSLATVLMRAGRSEVGCIVDASNQRGNHRFFVKEGRLLFWQSDWPGFNLPGLLGLKRADLGLAEAVARHANRPLLDGMIAQRLCTRGQAMRAWKVGASRLFEAGLLTRGRVRIREVEGFDEIIPDLELDLDEMILAGIRQAQPNRVQRYLAPRSNGLVLPGPRFDEVGPKHDRVFDGDLRNRIDGAGTMSAELLGRTWSDPRRRDKVMAEFYALLVTDQVILLQGQDDTNAAADVGFGVMQSVGDHRHDDLTGIEPELRALREEIRRLHVQHQEANHYEALRLEVGASKEEVADAFRELFSKYHTDRYRGLDLGSDLELLQQVLARWGQARDLLLNDADRGEYDLALERQASGASMDVDALLAADGLVRKAERAMEQGRYDVGHGLMQQVLELRPDAEQYHFLHRFCEAMTGTEGDHYDELKALAGQVTVPGGDRMLGQLALRSGERDVARRHFKAAVDAKADDHVASRELRRLEAST